MRKVITVIIVLISLGFVYAGTILWLYFRDNKMSNFTDCFEIYVYPETTASQVLTIIADSASVKSIKSLKRTFKDKQVETYLQPGHYIIEPEFSSVYVARMLNNAWQSPVKLVLEGTMRSREAVARRISAQMMIDSVSVVNALKDSALLAKFGHDTTNFFSLIYPATYELIWTDGMETILSKQKQALDAFWTKARLEKASKLGLTREEVSILASIVKGETNYEPEMPKIAGVYLNRLAIGMKLQADPTVVYCYGYILNRVLRSHLTIDNPYNTYKYAGLPPGPIMVPTKACLEAVLNADYGAATRGAKGNLYFCASPEFNGSHLFAHSYSEQLRNAKAYQRALNNRNK